MVIDLTPEQEEHIQQVAAYEGKTPQQVVLDAVFSFQEDAELSRILDERLKDAESGVFIEEDEMDIRFKKMLGR